MSQNAKELLTIIEKLRDGARSRGDRIMGTLGTKMLELYNGMVADFKAYELVRPPPPPPPPSSPAKQPTKREVLIATRRGELSPEVPAK